MTKRDLALPPEMVQFFSAYMEPAAPHDAQVVEAQQDDNNATLPHTNSPPR
jgi:hypothetical protein